MQLTFLLITNTLWHSSYIITWLRTPKTKCNQTFEKKMTKYHSTPPPPKSTETAKLHQLSWARANQQTVSKDLMSKWGRLTQIRLMISNHTITTYFHRSRARSIYHRLGTSMQHPIRSVSSHLEGQIWSILISRAPAYPRRRRRNLKRRRLRRRIKFIRTLQENVNPDCRRHRSDLNRRGLRLIQIFYSFWSKCPCKTSWWPKKSWPTNLESNHQVVAKVRTAENSSNQCRAHSKGRIGCSITIKMKIKWYSRRYLTSQCPPQTPTKHLTTIHPSDRAWSATPSRHLWTKMAMEVWYRHRRWTEIYNRIRVLMNMGKALHLLPNFSKSINRKKSAWKT